MKFQKKTIKYCQNCNKPINVVVTNNNNNENVFCSKDCLDQFTLQSNNFTRETKVIKPNLYFQPVKDECPICKTSFKDVKMITIDVNNDKKIICENCHNGLSVFSNNITYLKNAIKFLEN